MATLSRQTTWSDNQVLTAAALNAEFNNIINDYNGGITNANISASAAIAASKISGTAVTLAGTETLSNKTLTNPTINAAALSGTITGSPTFSGSPLFTGKPVFTASVPTIVADTDGATITFNMSAGNLHSVELGGNRTLAVSNVATNQSFIVILKQDGTGSRTVTWWSGIKWVDATVPTLTTTINRYDIFVFIYDGTNYYGSIYGQNIG